MVNLNDQQFIALAYADDLAIVGNKKNRLLQAIEIVTAWSVNNNIAINKKKSGILIHDNAHKSKQMNQCINGIPLL